MSLSNVDLLRNSIPIISEIIDEGVFKVDSNGLSLLSPDRSMIAVVNFQLLASAFDDFKVTHRRGLFHCLKNKTESILTLQAASGMELDQC